MSEETTGYNPGQMGERKRRTDRYVSQDPSQNPIDAAQAYSPQEAADSSVPLMPEIPTGELPANVVVDDNGEIVRGQSGDKGQTLPEEVTETEAIPESRIIEITRELMKEVNGNKRLQSELYNDLGSRLSRIGIKFSPNLEKDLISQVIELVKLNKSKSDEIQSVLSSVLGELKVYLQEIGKGNKTDRRPTEQVQEPNGLTASAEVAGDKGQTLPEEVGVSGVVSKQNTDARQETIVDEARSTLWAINVIAMKLREMGENKLQFKSKIAELVGKVFADAGFSLTIDDEQFPNKMRELAAIDLDKAKNIRSNLDRVLTQILEAYKNDGSSIPASAPEVSVKANTQEEIIAENLGIDFRNFGSDTGSDKLYHQYLSYIITSRSENALDNKSPEEMTKILEELERKTLESLSILLDKLASAGRVELGNIAFPDKVEITTTPSRIDAMNDLHSLMREARSKKEIKTKLGKNLLFLLNKLIKNFPRDIEFTFADKKTLVDFYEEYVDFDRLLGKVNGLKFKLKEITSKN